MSDLEAMEAVAAQYGGVLAWTRDASDPMVDEVVVAVVVRVEELDGENGPMVVLTIGDPTQQTTYVLQPASWQRLVSGEALRQQTIKIEGEGNDD